MTIDIVAVTETAGTVHAQVDVRVADIEAHAHITMAFAAPEGTGAGDWQELAYDRALMMLDPV